MKLARIRSTLRTAPPLLVYFLEISLGLGLIAISFWSFLNLRDRVFANELVNFDTSLSLWLYSLRSPILTTLMSLISFFGQEVAITLAVAVVVVFLIKRHQREAVLFTLTLAAEGIFNAVLKNWIERPRPTFAAVTVINEYSFPSGHSSNAFVFYALAAYFAYHFTGKKKLSFAIAIISALIIILVGVSRVYLGVHYPTDVLAGYLVGFWWFLTMIVLEKTFVFFRLFRENQKVKIFVDSLRVFLHW